MSTGATLWGQLQAPSWLGEMFFICDASDFSHGDLKQSLIDIAHGGCSNHVLLTVSDGSGLLGTEEWAHAKEQLGLIEEPRITTSNYRSTTRSLLRRSDLAGVEHFGEDDQFLARVKSFVQTRRWTSPRALAMEIERIILIEVQSGAPLRDRRDIEHRERQVLSEMLNQFLDHCCAGTLQPLIQFADRALQSGSSPSELLARLCRASAGIVVGRDQRYKRNREGNLAVLPYLAWSILLLEAEETLLGSNFMVAFENLCQMYHSAARESANWFGNEASWQTVARWLLAERDAATSSLDQTRAKLQSALKERMSGLPADLAARFGWVNRNVAVA
ncbi:hypothetical protein [Bradyrhizobium sp. USDA 4461]